jgi:two-component system sensor histidine kinase/response regulator
MLERGMDKRSCVLVVDDEERNRSLMRAMLKDVCRTVEAGSAAEALEILKRERVDLVLLDVMMPGGTGYDACWQIKDSQRESLLPVLLITALNDQEDRNAGLEAGADDFLTKPVDRRELILRVRAFLRLRAQDTLIRTQLKKLSALQSAKDELLSLMVHDLRSPLAGVIAHLSMLIDELPEGTWREDARAAMSGADLIRVSLEETLQIRLLEEGQLPVRRSMVQLADLVAGAVASLDPVARRKGIGLKTAVEGGGSAWLDGKLVRRAIENLLGNAIKYTPEGKEISLILRNLPGAVEVEVCDRGPGIPSSLKTSMFEKFGSVEATKGDVRKGIGLGLYLVRLVAEGHFGTAQVLDRDGGGAVFRVRLATEVPSTSLGWPGKESSA